jgi:hypothetical protein
MVTGERSPTGKPQSLTSPHQNARGRRAPTQHPQGIKLGLRLGIDPGITAWLNGYPDPQSDGMEFRLDCLNSSDRKT